MFSMSRFPTLFLVASLVFAPLSGCAVAPSGRTATGSRGSMATTLAQPRLPQVGRQLVRTQGDARVLLTWDDQRLLLPSLQLEEPATEELASALLLVAADMLVAGARAWLVYAVTHRGDNFDRETCARLVVTAMVAAALSAVPVVGSILSNLLLPVVLAWIARSGKWPWQVDMKGLLSAGADLHQLVVKALLKARTAAFPSPVPA